MGYRYLDEEHDDEPFYTKKFDRTKEGAGTLDSAIRALPETITGLGYALSSLSAADTMDVKCPCCSKKIGLFPPANGKYPYMINNYGHCSHFGDKGEFPDDAIGFTMAARFGVNNRKNAKEAMAELNMHGYYRDNWKGDLQKKEEKEKKDKTTVSNMERLKASTSWGQTMPDEAYALLEQRGITKEDVATLRPTTLDGFGFCRNVKTLKTSGNGYYYTTGFVFALSENTDGTRSYHVRRTKKDCSSFVTKDDANDNHRFYTIGPSRPFNMEMLDYANGLEPVFVTEGPLDAVNMEIALHREDNTPNGQVIALQGCENKSYLYDELKRRGGKLGVFLAMDDDSAGIEAQKAQYELLSGLDNVNVLPFPGYLGKKDMNDLWMTDRETAADWMQMISSIGRRILDGRLLEDDGKELLMGMKTISLHDYRYRRPALMKTYREMVEKVRTAPEKAEEEKKNEARAEISRALRAISEISKEGRGKI